MEPDRKLSNAEAAEYLGVRPSTLNDWRSTGRGPAYLKIGSRVLYRVRDLDEFLETCVVRPCTETEA